MSERPPVLRKRAHLIDIPEEVFSLDDLRVLDLQIAAQLAFRARLRDPRLGQVILVDRPEAFVPRHVHTGIKT